MILTGIAAGAAVCVFGIWAFLRGQKSMAEIYRVGEPEPLHGPGHALHELLAKEKCEKPEPDFAGELRELFRDVPGHQG